MSEKLFVTKSYLPDKKRLIEYIDRIWQSGQLTNNGELVRELEKRIISYLSCNHFLYCNNGTIVLQMALKAMGITGEVITTPFSYVATLNSILWEGCTPVFIDINNRDFNINAELIEEKISPSTKAILVTHVFGNPCDIDKIKLIADKYNLVVIYDAAHAFGVEYKGQSIFNYGDVSTCSFHATKLFHSAEGGGLFCNDKTIFEKLSLIRQFGHIQDDYYMVGINGKASELNAAMGLCILDEIEIIIENRKNASAYYTQQLNSKFQTPVAIEGTKVNYAYYPILLESESDLMNLLEKFHAKNIIPRRYFYPSLNTLPFVGNEQLCPVSEDISKRVLCLPFSANISELEQNNVLNVLNS